MNKKGEIIEDGAIAIKDDKITYVGEGAKTKQIHAEKIIDANDKLAMPGLINCHTHLSMTLFRGYAEDLDLKTWLEQKIWPVEAKLTSQDIYDGALLGCLEMIKNGVTCFADMYFHEDRVAEAVEKAGLRAVLAPGIIEAGNSERGEAMLMDAVKFAEKFHNYAFGRVKAQLGPHALYTCSLPLLRKVKDFAQKLGIGLHIHLAENAERAKEMTTQHGLSEVAALQKIGFLGPDVLAAHCIHLSDEDIRLMADYGVKVAYNPIANMKLAQGVARIKDMVKHGITVGIGTDGPASNNGLNIFESMKVAALLQKVAYNDSKVLPSKLVVEMATRNGAMALGLEHEIGSLEVEKKADLIIVDLKKPHLTPLHDIYANLVYSAQASDVDTVIVNGRILMENRKVKTLDEEAVMEGARQAAHDLLMR
jgi:5-methylthioadenosine/S-adenosylhomocysteine deaminase